MQREDRDQPQAQAPISGDLVSASDWQQARLHFHRQKLVSLGYMQGAKLQQQGRNSLPGCQ